MVSDGNAGSVFFFGCGGRMIRNGGREIVYINALLEKKGCGTYSILLLEVYMPSHVEKEVHET